ncbi:MAG TPA: CHAT domain-containing protein [Flavobacteriales bacterium]|nr:CHAT domain-containing protein [Flavobacteriales bacterium]HQW30969.1 CHAT domain-containing protein [Flavobacteriales bacterium]HQY02633.1 CHAT domain-containing protein [Flavobacteriales bacterium]
MRRLLLLLAICASMGAGAQELARRHALIDTAYKADRHAEVARLIDLQLKEAVGTPWEDSLHLYVYKYGRACRKLKDADAGVAAAERVCALVKRRGDPEHELAALFDLSWIYYEVGRMKESLRVDSTAVQVAEGAPEIPLSERGRACQYVAFDHSVLGDHASSAKYALMALAHYGKADSIPPTQWSESYNAVGTAYLHMGKVNDAGLYLNKALDALGDGTSEAILTRKASTCGNLGVLWQGAGDYARSKIHYYEGLQILDYLIARTTDPAMRDEAIVNRSRGYVNLATVYHQYGDEGRALELLQMAWNDRSKVLEADDPQLLAVRERMADVELAAGDLGKAEELTRNYLLACERKFGKKSEEYIRVCSKLGDIALRMGNAARADSLFSASIAAGHLNTDANINGILATTLQTRARMHEGEGRNEQALNDLLRARDILVNINGPAHYKVASSDVLLAEAAFGQGDPDAALAHSRQALDLLQDRITSLQATNAPQTFNDPHILPDAIYWKVRSERKIAGPGKVGKEWNDDLDLAIRALERNKAAVRDEASKLLLIAAQKNLFDLALDVADDRYAGSGTDADLERFINISEADRSILLKDRLNGFAGLHFAGVPDSVTAREQELYTALDLDPEDRAVTTDMARREKAYAEFLTDLERNYPDYFNLRYGEPQLTLADIHKKLLTPQRQLLGYANSGEYLYAWVSSLEGDTVIRLASADIGDAVKALNTAIMARTTGPYAEAAYRLYQLAIAPVEHLLTRPELLIIPDGPLHAVNFETLLTRPGTKGFRDHLLIQRHTIAYLLSATTALQFAEMSRERSKGVLAIAPGFTDQLKQNYLSGVKDSTLVDRDYLHFVRQPFAERTVQALGTSLSAQVLTGNAASEGAFREAASRYGILHLGTHAEMNATSPMYSRLVLTKDGGELDPDDDGYLHAYEIYELDLRAQLAVLTACATGTGKEDAGEGVRSLGYAFAYSGCPSLVVSLWNIDEKVSAEIIAKFYEHLADGMPKHKALRQAKLDFLAKAPDELGLPYYWAGMVLVGDVEPVALGRTGWPIWAWAVIAGALLCLFWWRRRMRTAPSRS